MPDTIRTRSARMSRFPRRSNSTLASAPATGPGLIPRVGLTRARVIAAGIELVDRQGLAGFADLTLASVAVEVGVAVPSLYRHVGSLADRRRAIAVDSVESLTLTLTRATTESSGRDAVGASGVRSAPQRMIDAISMLHSALHGFVVLELGGGFGLPDDPDRSFEVMVETVISGVERLAASVPTVPVLAGQDRQSGWSTEPTGGHHVQHHRRIQRLLGR
ncbi:TetR/AcrR family transcriptional regulator [Glaciihabitans sp. INWT7]|uniref:TetR/AcrR family transcriptional regulator n=1 Tax=Glaciihabitans sp. INWT7 TaxID=2596912 RepID=UPI0021061949|nr:TetR-like C-terminal domain-containing protein [Glaciihabitans sp. INWT7]